MQCIVFYSIEKKEKVFVALAYRSNDINIQTEYMSLYSFKLLLWYLVHLIYSVFEAWYTKVRYALLSHGIINLRGYFWVLKLPKVTSCYVLL
jgi:hypothetical protein